jgi:hypothetical protein
MAKGKRQPLKPDRPITSLVFPKKGRVYRAVEHPPRTQNELELTFGIKFGRALTHFKGRKLLKIESGAGRGDLICYDEHGSKIKIQMVEVIDHKLRLLNEIRTTYAKHLHSKYSTVMELFSGCTVTLVDSGDPPYLPSIKTADGRKCAEEIATWLKDLGQEVDTLECKKIRVRRTNIGPDKREVSVSIKRFIPGEKNVPYSFQWSGGGPSSLVNEPRNLLPEAVRKKIDKHYSKPKEPFWLLAYSTDTLLSDDDPDVCEAAKLLGGAKHPFDEVWYIFPYNNVELGHIVQVWTRKPFTINSTANNPVKKG